MIRTLIRKKRLALMQSQQELGLLRRQEERQKELIELQTARLKRERDHWYDGFGESKELVLHQFIFAKAHMNKLECQLEGMTVEQESLVESISRLEDHAKKSNKEIEKLEEIADTRLQEEKTQELQKEWAALDQWIINSRGSAS